MEKETVQRQLEDKADELFGKSGDVRDRVQDDILAAIEESEDYFFEIDRDKMTEDEIKSWFDEEIDNVISALSEDLYEKETFFERARAELYAVRSSYDEEDTSDITDITSEAEAVYNDAKEEYYTAEDDLEFLKRLKDQVKI